MQSSQLRWHVIYGNDSIGKLTVLVDASSGVPAEGIKLLSQDIYRIYLLKT